MADNEDKPKLLIATPMYGGMCTGHYVQGLLLTIAKMRSVGVEVKWSQMMNESLITRARNELVRQFLDTDATHLMFVDADIGFDGQAIATLLAADKDVACGIYPKKEVNWASVEAAAKIGKEDLSDYAGAFVLNMVGGADAETDEDGMFEIRHGGTGFMLIKRNVFEELQDKVPTYRVSSAKDPETGDYIQPLTYEYFSTSVDKSGALLSEDYHFCEVWREHGGKVYANPFIQLRHVGSYVFGGDIIKSGANLK
jgi:hypothetical protein